MRLHPAISLLALRRRAVAIVWVLLPALALAAVSAPLCAAMVGSATHPATHTHADAHAGHHSSDDDAPAPPLCPHCPLDASVVNGGHGPCIVGASQDSDGVVQAGAASDRGLPAVLASSWMLPAASTAPPLIGARERAPYPVAAVALNLRHRVLLI
jgi:hypothetical protein